MILSLQCTHLRKVYSLLKKWKFLATVKINTKDRGDLLSLYTFAALNPLEE